MWKPSLKMMHMGYFVLFWFKLYFDVPDVFCFKLYFGLGSKLLDSCKLYFGNVIGL